MFHRAITVIEYIVALGCAAGLVVVVAPFLAPDCGGPRLPRLRRDGNIVEWYYPGSPPRPYATVVGRDEASPPMATVPLNEGIGPCHDPYFKLPVLPEYKHVFVGGEVMSVEVQYSAPGCKTMAVTFAGRHRQGSPWYNYWCNEHLKINCGRWTETDFGRRMPLTSDAGSVMFRVGTGHDEGILIPDEERISLEGFQLCALVIYLTDGVQNGSSTWQQVDLGCDYNSKKD